MFLVNTNNNSAVINKKILENFVLSIENFDNFLETIGFNKNYLCDDIIDNIKERLYIDAKMITENTDINNIKNIILELEYFISIRPIGFN